MAFGYVDHNILMCKLECYGARGNIKKQTTQKTRM